MLFPLLVYHITLLAVISAALGVSCIVTTDAKASTGWPCVLAISLEEGWEKKRRAGGVRITDGQYKTKTAEREKGGKKRQMEQDRSVFFPNLLLAARRGVWRPLDEELFWVGEGAALERAAPS